MWPTVHLSFHFLNFLSGQLLLWIRPPPSTFTASGCLSWWWSLHAKMVWCSRCHSPQQRSDPTRGKMIHFDSIKTLGIFNNLYTVIEWSFPFRLKLPPVVELVVAWVEDNGPELVRVMENGIESIEMMMLPYVDILTEFGVTNWLTISLDNCPKCTKQRFSSFRGEVHSSYFGVKPVYRICFEISKL